ncbi:cytosolic Fe-S cluster assembling factor cfd1 [Saccharata proteae CBS 121410]|uniref:Cytosolic Fe-S cluster assembling factor cfd1 n=1 Tax=Saccharata proteae CBS 121410 TaxID=1314787 RepID=A0A9P4I294_9PEZI|nr:cytosolic Fe-S cluster assembling factor cfd1 [Saccharata proteae CBS 121410]
MPGLENVKNIVLVLSGKGGVGKSSVTTQLALTLSLQGHSVGVLDIDLTGPSVPRFFGVEDSKVRQAPGGWIPVPVHDAQTVDARSAFNSTSSENEIKELSVGPLSVMSLGFILSNRTDAVIWRGPKKTAMVRQFLSSVLWPPGLDYLLIDTPPGTSDEHISLLETLHQDTASNPTQLAGAVVVTTPQAIAISDVKKELNFCKKVGVRVLGVVENMAGFVCPSCSECTNVFSKGGGEVMAMEFGVRFLGSVPIDPAFVMLIEEGRRPVYPKGTVVAGQSMNESKGEGEAEGEYQAIKEPGALVDKYTSCSLYPLFSGIVKQVVDDVEKNKMNA